MDDVTIELLKESVSEANGSDLLPLNFVSVGEIDKESVRVYIKQEVYKRIEKFAKEDISKEVGSILLGDYIEQDNKKYVMISSYIEAKFTDASASTLTFTHDTWDYIYRVKDIKYPDKKIVGWQHTHPGYGIFLSNYDLFIQENFFNLPWQIAYVVDPIADTRGCFEWRNNKVSKMTGFYVYDDIGKKIKISEKSKQIEKRISHVNVILSILLMISMLFAVSFNIEKNTIMRELEEVRTTNEELELFARNKIKDNNFTKEKTKNIDAENHRDSDEEKIQNTEKNLDIESFQVYRINQGDDLETICKQFNIDYMKNISKIMKINNITDANKIYAGETLYLPINK